MRRLLFVLLWLASAMPAQAAVVLWQGARPVAAAVASIELRARALPSESSPTEFARRELAAHGHYWPFFSEAGDTLRIAAGPAGIAGDVQIRGAADSVAMGMADAFRRGLRGTTGRAATDRAQAELVQAMVADGFPFAQARLIALDVATPPSVNFVVSVFPGPMVYAGSLRTGATRTSPLLFIRESGWQRGARLDDRRLAGTRAALGALDFVEAIDTALLVAVTADTADLFFAVREAPGVRAGGVAGWIPASGGRSGYWVGEIDLNLRSPFGGGRSVRVQAARRDPESRRTHLEYWEPWPFGAPFWLGLNVAQNDFDTNFIETTAGVTLRLAGGNPRWEAGLSWARITPEESPSAETFPARRYTAGVSVADSTERGTYRIDLTWSRHRLFSRADVLPPAAQIDHTQGRFGARGIVPLARAARLEILADGAGTLVRSAFIPSNLLFRIGGVHTLRGYREEQFLVEDYARAGLELHFGRPAQTLFFFGEGGWLNTPGRADRLLGAFGVGLRARGRFEVLFAVPTEGGVDQAKVHLALSTGR